MTDSSSPKGNDIAIIGIGCLFPKAPDLGSYWSNIKHRIDGIGEIPSTHWNPEDYFDPGPKVPDHTYSKSGGFLDPVDFDPLEFGIAPNAIEATDTTQLLGLVAAREALEDAGYGAQREFDREKVSVVLGVTGTLPLVIPLGARLGHPLWRKALSEAGVENEIAEDVVRRIGEGYVPWQEASFPGLLGNVAAGRIASRLDLHGTNCAVDAACASSLSAVHLASLELSSGHCDLAVSGGLDTFNDIFMYMCFSKTPALSPGGHARPFDRDADGTTLGEGLGVVVLKRLADAERDGDRIYAVIRSMGSSSDGRGQAIYAPSADGQRRALERAYGAAGVSPSSIELVEAHGTGTKVGDAIELSALSQVYAAAGDGEPWCAVGSVKSQIGHTKAAAGAASLIKTAMALHDKVLPPTLKVAAPTDRVADGAGPLYVNTEARPWLSNPQHPRRAGVSAFGFGGSNFHCVVEEYQPTRSEVQWDGRSLLLPFSAETPEALEQQLSTWPRDLEGRELRRRCALARERFRAQDDCRLVLAPSSPEELSDLIEEAIAALRQDSQGPWYTPRGAAYGSGDELRGPIAFLYPGQGAQYPGMLRDLACTFPELLQSLEEANGSFEGAIRLSDRIFPRPVFDDDARQQQIRALRDTDVAQPALGAVSHGAFQLLSERFGLRAAAHAGHSYGELVALACAGRMTSKEMHRFSGIRGRLMAEAGDGDRGSMLAVQGEIPSELLDGDLVVANRNTPTQQVLSGPTPAIEDAQRVLDERGIRCTRLEVAAAFHSALVANAEEPWAKELGVLDLPAGTGLVYSDTTAAPYPEDTAAARDLLAGQLAKPVDFVGIIESLFSEAKCRTFVEIGPGRRLTGMVGEILGERAHQAIALDPSSGRGAGMVDLARLLARVASLGHPIELDAWDPAAVDYPEISDKGFKVQVTGANHYDPPPARPPIEPKAPLPTASPEPPSSQRSVQSLDQAERAELLEALRVTQQGMTALQTMQAQTAELHRRFLEGQEAAQQDFSQLLNQHERLFGDIDPSASVPRPSTRPPAAQSFSAPTPPPAPTPAPSIEAKEAMPPQEAPAAPAPAASEGGSVETEQALLAIVAEKTGYPSDMLDLDMGLDADLGIDSIKRVEILSALRETLPEAPELGADRLASLHTLREIAEALQSSEAPTPTATPVATETPGLDASAVLLEVVAAKTGYPANMLDLDMGLDADLGIDSIKRVEILSALREQLPGAPELAADRLASLHTLREIAEALGSEITTSPPSQDDSGLDAAAILLAVVSSKTGYPENMLDLDMGLDADLGIDSIKRVEILSAIREQLPGAPELAADRLAALHTLREIAEALGGQSAAPSEPGPLEDLPEIEIEEARGARTGVIRRVLRMEAIPPAAQRTPRPLEKGDLVIVAGPAVPGEALIETIESRGLRASRIEIGDTPGDESPAALILLAPEGPLKPGFPLQAFRTLRALGPSLRLSPRARLLSVSRLDGRFGLGELEPQAEILSAALPGLVKTASHEWPEVRCTALDLAPNLPDLAATIFEELVAEGGLEIGITPEGCTTPILEDTTLPNRTESLLSRDDVVLVTGGARGVTAEVAIGLAEAGQPTLIVLGRTPAPGPQPEWLDGLEDEADVKAALFERLEQPTPREVEEAYRRLRAKAEIRRNIARLRATGSQVSYRNVDVRDAQALQRLIGEIERSSGRVTALVHGAGVLADRRIEEKSDEDFQNVFATKVEGLGHLLELLENHPLRALVLFSSSTGRFGRKGQADYAAANEVLNKIAQRELRRRHNCRVVAVNWGPWDGGMVTPELKKLFLSEGVEVIPIDSGVRYLVAELATPGPVEVVVLGGGTEPSEVGEGSVGLPVAFERELELASHPFLASHVLGGRPVFPMAMIVEWLAHSALHGNPGLRFHGFDDLRVFKALAIEGETAPSVQVRAGDPETEGDFVYVATELTSGEPGSQILHARCRVALTYELSAGEPRIELPEGEEHPAGESLYPPLFHGEDLRAVLRVDAWSQEGIEAHLAAAPAPSEWLESPLRSRWIADPMAIDGAFQTMILWCLAARDVGSLPTFVGRYRQFRRFPADGTRIRARVLRSSEHQATSEMELVDEDGQLIARFEDYECVLDASLAEAFRNNELGVELPLG